MYPGANLPPDRRMRLDDGHSISWLTLEDCTHLLGDYYSCWFITDVHERLPSAGRTYPVFRQ